MTALRVYKAARQAKINQVNEMRILMPDENVVQLQVVMHEAHLMQMPNQLYQLNGNHEDGGFREIFIWRLAHKPAQIRTECLHENFGLILGLLYTDDARIAENHISVVTAVRGRDTFQTDSH